MHIIKITPNLQFEYQCTSGKFIRLPNQIESKKIYSVARIESNRNFLRPNWNALVWGRGGRGGALAERDCYCRSGQADIGRATGPIGADFIGALGAIAPTANTCGGDAVIYDPQASDGQIFPQTPT